jgi:hypothetical protein
MIPKQFEKTDMCGAHGGKHTTETMTTTPPPILVLIAWLAIASSSCLHCPKRPPPLMIRGPPGPPGPAGSSSASSKWAQAFGNDADVNQLYYTSADGPFGILVFGFGGAANVEVTTLAVLNETDPEFDNALFAFPMPADVQLQNFSASVSTPGGLPTDIVVRVQLYATNMSDAAWLFYPTTVVVEGTFTSSTPPQTFLSTTPLNVTAGVRMMAVASVRPASPDFTDPLVVTLIEISGGLGAITLPST